jgi:hypothetical protein
VLRRGVDGEVYSIGGGHEVENVVLTRQILQLTAKPETLIQPVKDRPGHDRRYSVDSKKVRQLGWVPRHPFGGALWPPWSGIKATKRGGARSSPASSARTTNGSTGSADPEVHAAGHRGGGGTRSRARRADAIGLPCRRVCRL